MNPHGCLKASALFEVPCCLEFNLWTPGFSLTDPQVRPRSGYRARSQAGHGSTSGPSQKHLQYRMCRWKHRRNRSPWDGAFLYIVSYSIYMYLLQTSLCKVRADSRRRSAVKKLNYWHWFLGDWYSLILHWLCVYQVYPATYRGTKARQSSHRHGRGPHTTILHYCSQCGSITWWPLQQKMCYFKVPAWQFVWHSWCLQWQCMHTPGLLSEANLHLVLQEPIGNIAATVGMATGPIAGAWEFSCAAFCHTRFRIQSLAQLLSITTSC